MRESHKRSILKGITWRLLASGTTMSVVFLMSGSFVLMASVGVIDVTLKVLFYYFHERTWGRVRWGVLGVEPQTGPCDCGQCLKCVDAHPV